jgi:molecular chaperone Hsp33
MTSISRSLDALTPFVFEHAAVRGALVTLGKSTRDIVACHPYPPALARALVECCAASALLASTLKFRGSLLVQLAGDGPVRLAVVECSDALELRATAQWNPVTTAALGDDATLAELSGGPPRGRLTITLDPKGAGPMHQGIVALEAPSTAHLFEHYLSTSEQLASRLLLATRDGAAAGLLLQRLPASSAEDKTVWSRASTRVDHAAPSSLFAHTHHAATLSSLFPDDDLRVFDARATRFRCSCSLERVRNALRVAGREEVEAALAERGQVDVTCEFCNRRYTLSPDEARDVFAARESATTARH